VRPAFRHLTVVEGPSRLLSRRFALRDEEISIGRTESCYVAIPDQRVSRLHLQIVREGDGLFVVHRSQTNQTFLNGTVGSRGVRRRPINSPTA
jgi:pSer/pThr/pTyr-binding forkhead associated (FHA) protein